ncbi:hypothetical protein ACRRTK_008756 [Alexandromys fortis]
MRRLSLPCLRWGVMLSVGTRRLLEFHPRHSRKKPDLGLVCWHASSITGW